jgi:hypothetical protein
VLVFTTGVPAVAKLSKEDSQPVTLPVWPVKLRVAPFDPVQTEAATLTVPPTLTGVTVMVTGEELAEAQPPLLTTAL